MTQIAQKTLRDYLQTTEDAISKGRMDEAESKCQDILAQFPDSLEAQRLLGEVYLAKGALEEAQQAFDWVLTNDPENVIAYCDRALISERQDDYDTALDCYQQAYELSRGNSKIRQEFNVLSQKAGQQGFMLSRAGLARLYMRGNLLAQAIQEWEMVLALSPDRLDARTGLLETYWREGLYERVEQLATQILHDVPGCEKALLLLSYVTSLKNTAQAQDFIRRVETLDPDLLMAQDLFSDLFSSQPADPFLDLLKKPPVVLSSLSAGNTGAGSFVREQSAFPAPTLTEPTSGIWDSLQAWPEAKNELPFPVVPESGQDMPSSSIWSDKQEFDDRSWSDFAVSNPSDQSIYAEEPMAQKKQPQPDALFRARTDPQEEAIMEHPETQPEPWEALQDALGKINAEGGNLSSLSPEIWATLDKYLQNGSNAGLADLQLPNREEPVAPEPVFAEPVYESAGSSPSWMNSLDQNPHRQVSGPLNGLNTPLARQNDPSISSTPGQKSATPPLSTWSAPTSQNRPPEPPASNVPPTPHEAEKPKMASTWHTNTEPNKPEIPLAEEEDEDSFFGPAWLRSLGATGMDDEEEATYDKDRTISPEEAVTHFSAQTLASAPHQPEPKAETTPSWSNTAEVKPTTNSTPPAVEPSWMNSFQSMTPPSASEVKPAANNTPPTVEPSWMNSLQSLTPREPTPATNNTPPAAEPSWMNSLQSLTPSSSGEVKPASNNPAPTAEPSWMSSLQSLTPREAAPTANNTPPTADPSWMNTFQSMTPSSAGDITPTANSTQPENEPSWMSSLQSLSQPPAEPRAESSWIDALRQSPEPSWLSSLQPSAEPSWMDALQPQGDANTAFSSPYTNGNSPTSDANGDYNWNNPFGVIPETDWNNPAYPADTSWSQPINEAVPSEQANDPLLATLRELDQGLLAQGFVPLEPNSLSSLALPEEPAPYVEPLPQKPQPYVEPSLSSALAELGGFSSQPAPQVKENSPVKPVEERYGQEAGLWTTPAAPTPISRPTVPDKVQPAKREQPAAYTEVDPPTIKAPAISATPASMPTPTQFPYASTPAARTPRTPEMQTRQAAWNFRPSPGSGEAAPIVHIDPLLDDELETTMKRPAIRMETMQQPRMGAVKESAPSPASTPKGRTSGNRSGEMGLTNQERLIAGYQHQLVGDYDEAMQEYRIIIRGAPDLLSEVISNIRALLKLAPKYSAGYRVLGDAYMRQGEYLQAMEAYNKALTMAKKKA